MMRKQFLLLLLAVLSFLAGCKKEKPENKPDSNTTKTLKRVIETEGGITKTHTFSYDDKNRLTSISSNDNSESTTFTYDINGNVVKVENKVEEIRNVYEYTYNNGVPVSGTFKSYENRGSQPELLVESYEQFYTLENNLVTRIKMVVPFNPVTEEDGYELDYNLTYHNGNLVKSEAQGGFVYSASFTYGTKKPLFPVVFKYVMDPAGFSLQYFAKNEILTMAFDFDGSTLDTTVTNQLTYDSNGYVLTANNGETQLRFEYQ